MRRSNKRAHATQPPFVRANPPSVAGWWSGPAPGTMMYAPMSRENVILTITSLLAVLFFTVHVADDIVLGLEKGGVSNLPTIPIAVVWLYGTLVLAGRRSGLVIVLIFSFLASGIPVIHMMGKGIGLGSRVAQYSGHLFFAWTLIALGVTAVFSVILAVRGLWSLRRGELR